MGFLCTYCPINVAVTLSTSASASNKGLLLPSLSSLRHAGKYSLAFSPVHDALQDGGEWRDADASPDQDGMLRGEDLPGGRPVRSVHVALGSEGR